MEALFPDVAPVAKGEMKRPSRRWKGLVISSSGEVLSKIAGEDQVKVMTAHKAAVERYQRNRFGAFAIFGELQPL
jgi:hypothetical protein